MLVPQRTGKAWLFGIFMGVMAAASAADRLPVHASTSEPVTASTHQSPEREARLALSQGRVLRIDAQGAALVLEQSASGKQLQRWPLPQARSGASLTALPSGKILLWGGRLHAGSPPLDGGYLIDPQTQRLQPAQGMGLSARAGHTATVLTDGRVLFAGRRGSKTAQVWDEATQRALDVPMPERWGHAAHLQGDGRVRLSGGWTSADGVRGDLLFDPVQMQFQKAEQAQEKPAAQPQLAGSLPGKDATDVAVDARLALRFDRPMRLDEIDTRRISLLGPGGMARIAVTAAEGGRLAFVKPAQPLFPDTPYTLLVDGLHGSDGKPLALTAIDFRTTALAATATQAPLAPNAGAARQRAMGCGKQHPYPCHAKAQLRDGVWTPGQDNTNARWRVVGSQPQLPAMDVVGWVNKAMRLTSVTGRILRVDGTPVAGVEVGVGQRSIRTDQNGDFLLHYVPSGKQELYVDGSTANRPGVEYGQFVVGVELPAGQLTQLSYTMYLPRITARDKTPIASPLKRDVVLTHPDMPGLQVHIPAGTVLRDRKGRIVRELSIVPTPVNRAPFPVADNYPMYFTLEPGGAVVQGLTPEAAQGIRVLYPNYDGHPKGTQANFWIYDPAEGWRVYGKGRVTSDGTRFAPEAGVALHKTMGGSYTTDANDPPSEDDQPDCNESCGSAQSGSGASAGDPIDLRTGSFYYQETDAVVQDITPIVIRRHYRPTDMLSRQFGIATTFNYGYKLDSSAGDNYATLRLIPPNGVPITFTRIGTTSQWQQTGSITAFNGAVITQGNDALGYGYRLRFPDGSAMQFGNYAPNTIRWSADRFGNRTTFTYDAGLLARITSPSGRYVTLEYDANNRIKTIKDNAQNAWTYVYDAKGFLHYVQYPDLTTRRYSYKYREFSLMASTPGIASRSAQAGATASSVVSDIPPNRYKYYQFHDSRGMKPFQHGVASITDRRGVVILQNEYETLPSGVYGKVVKQTLPDGTSYSINYAHHDAASNTYGTLVTNPDGSKRRITFDTTTKYPKTDTINYDTVFSQKMTFERDGNGRVIAQVDVLNRRTQFTYNGIGQTTSVKYLAGTAEAKTITLGYNAGYQLTSIRDPLNRATTLGYTAEGCLASVTNPLGKVTRFTCNRAGQTTSITDPLGKKVTLQYLGTDLAAIIDPLNRIARIRYDILGRPIASEDAEGNVSQRFYDAEGRVTKLIDPTGNATEIAYDPNGKVLAVLKPHGNGITWTYDALGRLTERQDSLSQKELWTYQAGQLKTYKDRKGQVTQFAYDAAGRPSTTTYPGGATVTPTYDAIGRLTALADSLSGTLGWDYDAFDRIKREFGPQGSVAYTYDAVGRRQSMTAASQAVTEYTWDNADRLRKILQGTEQVLFEYDDADRLIKTTLPNAVTQAYAYNDASQLTGIGWAKSDGTVLGNLGYGYSATLGRLTAQTGSFASNLLPAASQGANAFDDNHRQTQYNGQALTYDANGNLTGDGARTYVWNSRDQLVQILQGGNAIASYQYDALGRRITRTESGATTNYLYDGLDAVQETQGSTRNPILTGLGIDERYARNDKNGRTYLITDHLGSTKALLDANGNVVNRYDYDPYGNVQQTGTGFSNPYQYTGREKDASGLMHYRARYYHPGMGRFIAEDPIGIADGLNTYAYVGGDPLTFTDPTGEFAWGLAFGAADLAWQLYQNDGDISCVNWGEVGLSLLGGGLLNGLLKGAFKFKTVGSHTWNATRKWMNKNNIQPTEFGQPRHHWALERNQGLGQYFPDAIKNQPWNTNPVSSSFNSWMSKSPWRAPLGAPSWVPEVAGGSALALGGGGSGCGCR